jgi:Gene product 88
MRSVRSLLTQGNDKVGDAIHLWSLPTGEDGACPGSTSVCKTHCYARSGRFRFTRVEERLAWNFQQAQEADFVDAMSREIRLRGCLVVRVHASGDFFDAEYARKWLTIMKRCPTPKFYWYTRSWRIASILPVLIEMSQLPNCVGWFSTDSETGQPAVAPPGIRIAHLLTEPKEPIEADLVFRIRRLRRTRLPLQVVCPSEQSDRVERTITCGSCRRCWE